MTVALSAGLDLTTRISELQSQGFRFFAVSNETVLPYLDTSPFGVDLETLDFQKPHREQWDVLQFLELYRAMNGLAFGPRGMPMPGWVMVDLALMPSAIVIIAASQERLQRDAHNNELIASLLSEAADKCYEGPIPVAGCCAAPTPEHGLWVGWSICSVLSGLGLGTVVRALALCAYRARRLQGVTQYDNPALSINTRFGKLLIRAAVAPVHTAPNAFIYQLDVPNQFHMVHSLQVDHDHQSVPAQVSFLLDPADTQGQWDMQSDIVNRRKRYWVVAPGWIEVGGKVMTPIAEEVL